MLGNLEEQRNHFDNINISIPINKYMKSDFRRFQYQFNAPDESSLVPWVHSGPNISLRSSILTKIFENIRFEL